MTQPDKPRGYTIDGRVYVAPTIDDLTMDEAVIVEEYSSLSLDELLDGASRPTVLKALAHIAYQRQHPDTPKSVVSQIVGRANLMAALAQMVEEVEEGPPVEEPDGGEQSKPNGSDDDSGNGSETGSGQQVTLRNGTGLPVSVTPATSARGTSPS